MTVYDYVLFLLRSLLLVFFLLYVFNSVFYSRFFKVAIIKDLMCLYRANGRPKFTREYAATLIQDSSTLYFLYSIMMSKIYFDLVDFPVTKFFIGIFGLRVNRRIGDQLLVRKHRRRRKPVT